MGEIILVASGKGGVGKSSLCTLLGAALAQKGRRVLLLEMDSGRRGLDILAAAQDEVVFDLSDILAMRCPPAKALLESRYDSRLFLICASNDPLYRPQPKRFSQLLSGLSPYFDEILIDAPGELGDLFLLACSVAARMLLVTTPDPVAVRDARRASDLAWDQGVQDIRLVINRVPLPFSGRGNLFDLDDVIDETATQLIAVIPEDPSMEQLSFGTLPLGAGGQIAAVARALASRILGEEQPLIFQ